MGRSIPSQLEFCIDWEVLTSRQVRNPRAAKTWQQLLHATEWNIVEKVESPLSCCFPCPPFSAVPRRRGCELSSEDNPGPGWGRSPALLHHQRLHRRSATLQKPVSPAGMSWAVPVPPTCTCSFLLFGLGWGLMADKRSSRVCMLRSPILFASSLDFVFGRNPTVTDCCTSW